MKKPMRHRLLSQVTTAALVFSLALGIMLGGSKVAGVRASAKSSRSSDRTAAKLSPELSKSAKRNSGGSNSGKGGNRVKVIVEIEGAVGGRLGGFLNGDGVRARKVFKHFPLQAVEIEESEVEKLAEFPEVKYVSVDKEVGTFGGHLASTTGTDNVRRVTNALGQNVTLDGTGVGIAVLDSGIDPSHVSFTDAAGASRIVFSRDFTGEGRTDDPYGHGTHVASIAAGNGKVSKSRYIGVAPNANIVNLRVLGSSGVGTASMVLGALDWLMTNRARYNVRVVNMSLGMLAVDTYTQDPLCQGVRRLFDQGVVVVAAAGNNGKSDDGQKLYGHIHSPGNEPSAVTVGAVNTFGTDYRADDQIATYSSRGPTRSFWTDARGVRHYDNLIKPDLAAPGTKIIAAKSSGNLLATRHPSLDTRVSPDPRRDMMRLNGTSMAAPAVSGAAALMLQANPTLTPNLVKVLLMYTAQPLAGFNTLEQGAGELNVDGAVRLSLLVKTTLGPLTALGFPMLRSAPPAPQSTIDGFTFRWSQGINLGRTVATGAPLITQYQKVYGAGVLLSDGVLFSDGVLVSDGALLSAGITLSENILTSSGITISEGSPFLSLGVLLSDGVLLPDGVLLSDGLLRGDSSLLASGLMHADAQVDAYSGTVGGDATNSMTAEADTGADGARR